MVCMAHPFVVKAMAQAITAAEAICGREISGSCDIAADPASIYAKKGILAEPVINRNPNVALAVQPYAKTV